MVEIGGGEGEGASGVPNWRRKSRIDDQIPEARYPEFAILYVNGVAAQSRELVIVLVV